MRTYTQGIRLTAALVLLLVAGNGGWMIRCQ
jgi:hypothetical protein